MSENIQKVLNHLENVKQTGPAQWQARCPAHDDRHPSLSIGETNDEKVLLKCHAGCSTKEILTSIGLCEKDLFADSGNNREPDIIATYNYCDNNGVLLYQVVRHSNKKFKQRQPNSSGGWINNIKGVPRILYRLPQIIAADSDAWIFIVEGEKDADNLTKIGLVATTNSGGAGKWETLSDDSVLYGRKIIVVPDKDEPGLKHCEDVCRILSDKVKELKYLLLPGDCKDFTNWLDTGGTKEQLLNLVSSAPSWKPGIKIEISWPDPLPLDNPLPDVLPFDPELLPCSLKNRIIDIAERMQCPIDFPAVATMIALAGVVGRKIGIRPKRFDDWTVIPNLWGALIGRPSLLKSPALKAAMQPVDTLIKTESKNYADALSEFHKRYKIALLRKNVIQTKIKAAMKAGKDYAELEQELDSIDSIAPPARKRYIVNDSTVQALGEILAENSNGVILIRDELIGLLKDLEKQGQEAARAFYLEGWDGNGRHETDRIGRGNIQIEAVCLSIIGTIQPGPLRQYLREAVEGGIGDDGLTQRFQLAVWPDDPKEWVNVDRDPDYDAKKAAMEVFDYVNTVLPSQIDGAQIDFFDPASVHFLRFSDRAQERFDRWMYVRENLLRQNHYEAVMESHLTKYKSLIPSLALLIHIAEKQTGPVDIDALEKAIKWGEYLATHAHRIYASACGSADSPENLLGTKIENTHVADRFTVREIYEHHWSGLNEKTIVQEAVNKLMEMGWLREETVATGGRPTKVYLINPKIKAKY